MITTVLVVGSHLALGQRRISVLVVSDYKGVQPEPVVGLLGKFYTKRTHISKSWGQVVQ